MTTRRSIAALLLLAFTGFAQTPKPKFEVASVKLNVNNGPVTITPRRSGEHVTMHNVQLGTAFLYAYSLSFWQMEGNLRLPDGWNWYDIEAEAPASTSDADLRLMFQSLLEERFQLRVHRETREIKGWNLVIGKGGSRLKAANPDSVIATEGRPIGDGTSLIGGFNDGLHLEGKGATTDQLASTITRQLNGPVHNMTGLTGKYDYNLAFSRDDSSAADITSAPRFADALQSELGLKLEPTKEAVEVVVVDHLEKPTPN
jgi:uncharacterized protein (TIGR03435 family)